MHSELFKTIYITFIFKKLGKLNYLYIGLTPKQKFLTTIPENYIKHNFSYSNFCITRWAKNGKQLFLYHFLIFSPQTTNTENWYNQ